MPAAWTRLECELIVGDYLAMLAKECAGQRFSKAAHRRALKTKLNSRSEGSIEYKHQNISAVLIRAGCAYVSGYKPAFNYQSLLEEVVLERLAVAAAELDQWQSLLAARTVAGVAAADVLFVYPPERVASQHVRSGRPPLPRLIDYEARERRNRSLGENGEALVVELEKRRLAALGRSDLIDDIEWTSKARGDGAGYDIRSFAGPTDAELYIEVKTTNAGKYQPFFISPNEVQFSAKHHEAYALYRLFGFSRKPEVFKLEGSVERHVVLAPTQYRASFLLDG